MLAAALAPIFGERLEVGFDQRDIGLSVRVIFLTEGFQRFVMIIVRGAAQGIKRWQSPVDRRRLREVARQSPPGSGDRSGWVWPIRPPAYGEKDAEQQA